MEPASKQANQQTNQRSSAELVIDIFKMETNLVTKPTPSTNTQNKFQK